MPVGKNERKTALTQQKHFLRTVGRNRGYGGGSVLSSTGEVLVLGLLGGVFCMEFKSR